MSLSGLIYKPTCWIVGHAWEPTESGRYEVCPVCDARRPR